MGWMKGGLVEVSGKDGLIVTGGLTVSIGL